MLTNQQEDFLYDLYAVELIHRFAQDSLCYLSLEPDKEWFFGEKVEGMIAFVTLHGVAICIGDPICEAHHIGSLLTEFSVFCRERKLKMCFCSISQTVAIHLALQGFSFAKYGEEAVLNLQGYDLKGGAKLKLRQKYKRAEKTGIEVFEYRPLYRRDYVLEKQCIDISNEWLSEKKGKMSTFSVGDLNFQNPYGRRYFISRDKDKIQAVFMYSPYQQGKGYLLDVMRRRKDAVPGVVEHAVITVGMKLAEEGVETLSLGIAPLAGLKKETHKSLLELCMRFIYEKLNFYYDFKCLHKFKKKFSPCLWKERYIAYEKTLFLPKVGLILVKARMTPKNKVAKEIR